MWNNECMEAKRYFLKRWAYGEMKLCHLGDTSKHVYIISFGSFKDKKRWRIEIAPMKRWDITLPDANNSHLHMDGWKPIVSFWDDLFSGASC